MQFHEFAERFPLLEGEEYESLKQSIKECGGNTYPILYRQRQDNVAEGIDGRNRLRACTELGLEPQYKLVEIEEDQVVPRIISLNVNRRHITRETRKTLAVELRGRGYSARRIGEMLGCTHVTILNDLNETESSGGKYLPPDVVVGKDGKEYPASHPEQEVTPGQEDAQCDPGVWNHTPDVGDACEETPPDQPKPNAALHQPPQADSDPGDAMPTPQTNGSTAKPPPPLEAKPPAVLCAECKKLGWVKGCPNCTKATERRTFNETFGAAERCAARLGRLTDKCKDQFSALYEWVLELQPRHIPD